MAQVFAQAGAEVMISSRHADELRAAAESIAPSHRARVESAVADMTSRADVLRLAKTAVSTLGKVDVLVNNAGSNVPQALEAIADADWDRIVELNLTSCMAAEPGAGARHARAALGTDHLHFLGPGPERSGGPRRLLRDEVGSLGSGPGRGHGAGSLSDYRQLHCPRPVPHRSADDVLERRAAGGLRRAAPRWAAGGGRRSWRARPCCWPATPAATSPVRCWSSTAACWPK